MYQSCIKSGIPIYGQANAEPISKGTLNYVRAEMFALCIGWFEG